MAEDLDYPGRGGIWLGVGGLILAVAGVLVVGDVPYQQGHSRELLDHGVETIATSVRLTVYPGKGSPFIEDPTVVFTTREGRKVTAVLLSWQDNPQGMPEGEQAPASGTRYAMPLKILYDQGRPADVLALDDAHEWAADSKRPAIGGSLIGGGVLMVISAVIVLTRGARRRGLVWYRWFSEAPAG